MAPRPHWKGHLKLSLVSCPIALYPAISAAERVSFRQVNKQTGHRLRRQLVDEVTREPIDGYEKGRGYDVGEGQFVQVDDADIEAARQAQGSRASVTNVLPWPAINPTIPNQRRLAPSAPPVPASSGPLPPRQQNTHTIEIQNFVPRSQIDARYYEKPYYIVPAEQIGEDAFAVIREAMRGKDVIGLAHVVLGGRQRPIALEPMGKGIRGVTLRFNHEVRSEADYFGDIPDVALPEEMIRVAEHIIDSKTTNFDPALFLQDHFKAALVSIIREKRADPPMREGGAPPAPRHVPNLMDVLRRSVEAERPRRPAARPMPKSLELPGKPSPRPRARKVEARR
jgi:non-homologous end joining protein Ku